MDALGKVASTAIDFCGWALDCDKIGQDMADTLHGLCPEIFSGIGLYWRSDVVIAGMVISGIATIAALVEGVISIALATFACFLILSFSLYYISRYAEISEMEAQLSKMGAQLDQFNQVHIDLKGQASKFSEENQKFSDENQRLKSAVEVLSKGVGNIQEMIKLSQSLEAKIEASLKRLEQLQIENAQAESRQASYLARNQSLADAIARRAETLAALIEQLLDLKEEFIALKDALSASTDKSENHASHLQSIANQLEGILAKLNSQGFIDA